MGTVRATAMQHYVAALERELVPGARSVLAQMDADTLALIERSGRTDWLAIEINFDATELLTRSLGVERGEAFFRGLYRGYLDSPVLKPLMQGIRALGARSPLAYLKHTPRSYEAVFRDVGRPRVCDKSDHHVEIEFHELPAICLSPTMPWVRYTAAIYALSFDLAGCPGRFEVCDEDPATGFARVLFEW